MREALNRRGRAIDRDQARTQQKAIDKEALGNMQGPFVKQHPELDRSLPQGPSGTARGSLQKPALRTFDRDRGFDIDAWSRKRKIEA